MTDTVRSTAESILDALSGNRVAQVGLEIQAHISQIAELFKPGAKFTIVVRQPEYPDGSGDVIVTDDDLAKVLAAVQLRVHT